MYPTTFLGVAGIDIKRLIFLRKTYHELVKYCEQASADPLCDDEIFWKDYNKAHYGLDKDHYFPGYRGIDMAYLMERIKDLHFDGYDSNQMADFIWHILSEIFKVRSVLKVDSLISMIYEYLRGGPEKYNIDTNSKRGKSFFDSFVDAMSLYDSVGNFHYFPAKSLFNAYLNPYTHNLNLDNKEVKDILNTYFPNYHNDGNINVMDMKAFIDDKNTLSSEIKKILSRPVEYFTPIGYHIYPYDDEHRIALYLDKDGNVLDELVDIFIPFIERFSECYELKIYNKYLRPMFGDDDYDEYPGDDYDFVDDDETTK